MWDARIDALDQSTMPLDWLQLTYSLATDLLVVHVCGCGCQTRLTAAVSASKAETTCASAPREAALFLLGQARSSRSPGDVREQPVGQEGRSGEKWPGGGSLAAAETAAYCDMTPVMLVVH